MKLSGTLAEKGLHAFDGEPHKHEGHEVPRIWIVVADRMQAHIFRKTSKGIERIADAKPGHSLATHEHKGGGSFHGYDQKSGKNHHDDAGFIQKLAAWLDTAERERIFDRLVIVAAPRTLGDIRAALSKNVFTRVTAEVDKELTEMPEAKIKEHLNDIIWF